MSTDVIAALTAIDDKDNLYDWAMSVYRTPLFTVLLTDYNNLQVELKQSYSILEITKILDEMTAR